MTDEKKPPEEVAATEVNKPKTLNEIFQENGFIDVTKPGRAIGFVGAGGCTPPDSIPEEESPIGQFKLNTASQPLPITGTGAGRGSFG